MGDFLRYLYQETKGYIRTAHTDGEELWNEVEERIIFVLAHPNGWKGPSQQRYRASAVYGGLIPDTDAGHKRLKFVTEGEASMHYCIEHGLGESCQKVGGI